MEPRGELATGCSPVGEHRPVHLCQLRSEKLYDIGPPTPGRRAGPTRSRVLKLSDDRLMQILLTLAVLLFVSVGALALGRAGSGWVKWAKWGSIAIFSAAVVYALILTLRWALI